MIASTHGEADPERAPNFLPIRTPSLTDEQAETGACHGR